jgi:CIC family chloride channel protein
LIEYLEKWILVSAALGLLTGFVVALFDFFTNLTLWNFFSNLFTQNALFIFPCTLLALLLSGFLLTRSVTPVGSGTEELVKDYNDPTGKIDVKSFPLKMLAASITIGLGGSAGQEGPSVYAGGVIGSWVWSKLEHVGLNAEDRRTLILAGAAAGIGAIFKAPLTGIIFALEVPFKDDLAHRALIPSLVSSVSAYLTLIAIDGSQPLFQFPILVSLSLTDIAASAVLGLLVGIAALGFIAFYKGLRIMLRRLDRWFYWKALVGSALLFAIGLVSVWAFHRPYPLGLSYDLVDLALKPHANPGWLLALFGLKMVATSFTLGTTGVGGIFIPQIVMGASLGGLFGELFFPSRIGLFVAVGMASFLAAGYKTPLAAVTFVAETASGPGYLIPSLIAAAVSYAISGDASVSDYQKLRGEIDITQIASLRAADVMTKNVVAVPADLSVLDFVEEYLFKYQYKSFPVVDKDGLLGRISLTQTRSVPREKWFDVKIADVCSKEIYPVYEETKLQDVLDTMYKKGVGRVPVVDRAKPRRIIGIVAKSDIIRALEKERLGT